MTIEVEREGEDIEVEVYFDELDPGSPDKFSGPPDSWCQGEPRHASIESATVTKTVGAFQKGAVITLTEAEESSATEQAFDEAEREARDYFDESLLDED